MIFLNKILKKIDLAIIKRSRIDSAEKKLRTQHKYIRNLEMKKSLCESYLKICTDDKEILEDTVISLKQENEVMAKSLAKANNANAFLNTNIESFDKNISLLGKTGSLNIRMTRLKRVSAFYARLLKDDPIAVLHDHIRQLPEGKAVAYNFFKHRATQELGATLLAEINYDNNISFASDLLNMVSSEFLLSYNSKAAAYVWSRNNREKFFWLIDVILDAKEGSFPPKTIAECCLALLADGKYDVAEKLYSHYSDLVENDPDIALLFLGYRYWKKKKEKRLDASKSSLNLGLLAYGNPASANFYSSNMGDYVQSLAMLGLYIGAGMRLLNAEQYPVIQNFIEQMDAEPTASVNLHWMDRDDLSNNPISGPLWLPVFGWLAHPTFDRSYELDLPDNVYPLFISVHINTPHFLTPNNLALLKKYEPIGCRDYSTVRLLRKRGIRAFFSGCCSSRLNLLFKRAPQDDGKFYAVSYTQNKISPTKGETFVSHRNPSFRIDPGLDKERELLATHDTLQTYLQARHVRTDLLHCYFPCRSIGIPVTFIHNRLGDVRFEGLIDITDDQYKDVQKNFEKFQGILTNIFRGESVEEIYCLWKNAWEAEEEATTDYLNSCSKELSVSSDFSYKGWISQITKHDIHSSEISQDAVHVSFALDQNLTEYIIPAIRSLLAHTTKPIHLHILLNGLEPKELGPRLLRFGCHALTMYDFNQITYPELALLPHTSPATMHRILLPELLVGLDKIIYLDCDILVRSDIWKLWNLDLRANALAARTSLLEDWRTAYRIFFYPHKISLQQASLLRTLLYDSDSLEFSCFNAGVLVMDLAKLRQEDFTNKCLLLAHQFALHDQYCLNIFAQGNYAELPREWNHFAQQEIVQDPAIVHYADSYKPWNCSSLPFAEEWQMLFESVH